MDIRRGFQLGLWRVLPDQGILEGDDGPVHVEPKIMEVLVYLALHQDSVIKRDELISTVWGGTIVSDEVLSRAISMLRNVLADDRMNPQYIQTLPKVGYRLLMPATPLTPEKADSIIKKNSRAELAAVIALFGILIIAFIFWSGEDAVIDPGSPAAFASLGDWFDFLIEEKEGRTGSTSIAVLPFENLSEIDDRDLFSDGLTDELTTLLSKVKGLKVVARRSSYSFKNRNDDVPTIGRLLNVDAIFEGTVRQNGDQLRINALLSSVSDGYLIWSDVFEGDAAELFNMQETMAESVVAALRDHFEGGSLHIPPVEQSPPDMKAYQLYLMNGNFLWELRGEQALRNSIGLYRQALEIDPDFSKAYIGLANSLVLLPIYSSEQMDPQFREVEAILDNREFPDKRDRGEAEAIRAFMAWNRWDWEAAEEHFRIALALAPDSPNIYLGYSTHLASVGRKQDALEAARRARELDEISGSINDRMGVTYLWLGDNIRAAEHFAIGAQLGFRSAINPAYMILLLRLERYNELKSILAAYHRGMTQSPDWLIENVDTLFLKKNRKMSRKMAQEGIENGEGISPMLEFGLWVLLGDMDRAYETFHTFSESMPQYLQLEFLFSEEGREFRKDSRFDDLAVEIGWQDYWETFGGPDSD
jgi:TolB-like protein/DNA-binding winged helix-turn-helix (wHTH) protein